jgi:hypothetical protein
MRTRLILSVALATGIASPWAVAKEAANCDTKAGQTKSAGMQSCIAQMNDPARVREKQQQEKLAGCEQNAKNRNLQGNEKSSFISSCMNENQAAVAAKSSPAQRGTQAAAPASKTKKVSEAGSARPSNSCTRQAAKMGLKGKARNQFLKGCKPQ